MSWQKKMNMDPVTLREKNMVRQGQVMPAYYGETANSCALDKCMEKAKEMMKWDEKFPSRDMGNGKVRGVGVAMAMQGSGISAVDTASVGIKSERRWILQSLDRCFRYGNRV